MSTTDDRVWAVAKKAYWRGAIRAAATTGTKYDTELIDRLRTWWLSDSML